MAPKAVERRVAPAAVEARSLRKVSGMAVTRLDFVKTATALMVSSLHRRGLTCGSRGDDLGPKA